jgi:hypothetical protein
MSDLAFLATAFTVIFAVSMVVALVIHDPEQDTSFIQTTIEVFWLIVHVVALAALAIVYITALLWATSII